MRATFVDALFDTPWDPQRSHLGLAYGTLCPRDAAQHATPKGLEQREQWLKRVVALRTPEGYDVAARLWLHGLFARGAHVEQGTLLTPLLVGHGNSAPSEVGLTLHHTWGVPMIPGSALKGLVAHYLAACYGPDPADATPSPARARCQAPTFTRTRVTGAPGALYARLFGSPDVDGRTDAASAGEVVFFDALLAADAAHDLLQRDVLTPHHKGYYESTSDDAWPNEYENPEPVPWVCARSKLPFVFALAGRDAGVAPGLVELAARLLREALSTWGVGGKTTRGYGRFTFGSPSHTSWLEREQRTFEDARLAELQPCERWRRLLAREPERTLLDWVRRVYMGRTQRSTALCAALAGLPLDPDVEDAALAEALSDLGYVDAWAAGHARDGENVGLGTDKLRERAAALRRPGEVLLVATPPAWRARLDAAKDFAACRALAQVLLDRDPEGSGADPEWPLPACEALLARLRADTTRKAKPTKRAFVEEFGRYVAELRQRGPHVATQGGRGA